MKWFKHLTTSLDDPFVFDLIDKFGGDGYLVYFGTVEIMAREFDINLPGICHISANFLRKKLQLSGKKVTKILHFCEEKGKIFVKIKGDELELNCPKLKEMADEWTQRKLGSRSGDTPKILNHDTDTDTDTDTDITTTTTTEESETDSNEKPVASSSVPVKQIISSWNTYLENNTSTMTQLAAINPKTKRYNHVRARWKEHPDIDTWTRVIDAATKSDFLNGRAKSRDRPFSFDWMVQSADNFTKILEGKYNNGTVQQGAHVNRYMSRSEQNAAACQRFIEKGGGGDEQ
ncbi:MAG: hypothetical protein SVM79_00185 [Chloroflexota bacterium]|nr:hypothetical protein [Chloroflexota bacterium]